MDERDDKDKKKKEQGILSLIKEFYHPEEENSDEQDKEFDVFFRNIKDKIKEDSMPHKVQSLASDLEHQYLTRQQRFYQAKNRLESGFFKKENKFKSRKIIRSSIIMGIVFIGVGLASIARFQNNSAFKAVDYEANSQAWEKLQLDSKQLEKIASLDEQWNKYKNFEEEKIQIAKTKLNKELNQEEPNMTLIDKYQREILDLELNLRKQSFNHTLEKSFVLNDNQRLDFIRQN